MKPKNVSVSLYEYQGQLVVWGCRFTLDARVPEPLVCFDAEKQAKYNAARAKIEKAIAEAIAKVEIDPNVG